MMRVYPAQITLAHITQAYETLDAIKPSRPGTFLDLAQAAHALVLGWNYRAAPDIVDEAIHTFAWLYPLPGIPTECPPTRPFRDRLVDTISSWSHRDLWILSCHIYFGAMFSSPMIGHYRQMVVEYEQLVLKKPLLEWLLEDMPIHDADLRVVSSGVFLILWNAASCDLQRYASCCVYNSSKTEDPGDLKLLQMAFSAIVASATREQLEVLENQLMLLKGKSEKYGYNNDQFTSCWQRALWITQRAMGTSGYR